MKVFFIIVVILCVGCYPYKVGGPQMLGGQYMSTSNLAQRSAGCDVMMEKYDDMEDIKHLQLSDKILLESGSMTAYLDVQLGPTGIFKEVPLISIRLMQDECVKEYDAVIFKFSDGTIEKQIHDDGFNCNGIYTFNMTLMGRRSFRDKLTKDYVTKIRVYHLDEFSDFNLSHTDQNKIHSAMNCVLQ